MNFEYDGSAMIGWTSLSAGSYNFTAVPGDGALAGSYTLNGTTTTWVPLLDQDGSTIGLVNAAQVDSGPVTTYTYDPSGSPTATGTTNDWPFQYKGLEKEFTDPAPYYYTGSGQFYSPQMVRSQSQAGQTSTSGPGGGPAGNAIARPSTGSHAGFNTTNVGEGAASGAVAGALIGTPEGGPIGALPGAVIGAAIGAIVSFFQGIFGGSDNPPTPRKLLHGRHPLYPKILKISKDWIPDESSSGKPQFCGDPSPCPNARPLQADNGEPNFCNGVWIPVEQSDELAKPDCEDTETGCGIGVCLCYFGCMACDGSLDLYDSYVDRPTRPGILTLSGDCICRNPGGQTGCQRFAPK